MSGELDPDAVRLIRLDSNDEVLSTKKKTRLIIFY